MIDIRTFNEFQKLTQEQEEESVNFLHQHLETFGDNKIDIKKAIQYAQKKTPSFGGFVLCATENKTLIGVVVINETGMSGYIPENILVYIATHKNYRGQGLGKALMQKAIQTTKGNIALHVEHNNPAKHLYEKLGFTNKYLEMRLTK